MSSATPSPPGQTRRTPWAPDDNPRLLFATDTALETARALAEERDLWSVGGAVEPAAAELVVADRVICLAYDADQDLLFGRDDAQRRYEHDATGLLGEVARSGDAVRIDQALGHPQLEAAIDGPVDDDGRATGPLLAIPIRGSGPALAVLAVLRTRSAAAFSERDQRVLEILAAEVYRPFEQLHRESILRRALERALPSATGPAGHGADELFRPEALAHHARGRADSGDVLRFMPSWTRAAYVLLVLAVLSLGLAASVLQVDRWLSAPAIVLDSVKEPRGETAGLAVAALFPGSDRARLRRGQELRLRLDDGTLLTLEIETLSPRLLGPAAVRQALGPGLSDAIAVTGTVAWVEAVVDPKVDAGLYPGLTGQAQVRAGSERVFDAIWRGASDD